MNELASRNDTGAVSSSFREQWVFYLFHLTAKRTSSIEQFLRSAFSVNPLIIPAEAQIAVTGNETITTMGWYRRSPVWAYTIIPITVVAFMLYAAVAYTLWNVFSERGHESFTEVDPSNPIHVMMVSSARDCSEANNNLDDYLAGFERGGIGKNENTRVQLMNIDAHRKRFRVVKDVVCMVNVWFQICY